jgi:nucleoside-diphosphate-sugar epimerase
VDDIVEGIVRAAARTTGFHIWNLGGSQPVMLDAMIARLRAGSAGKRSSTGSHRSPETSAAPSPTSRGRGGSSTGRRGVSFDEGIDRFLLWFAERA